MMYVMRSCLRVVKYVRGSARRRVERACYSRSLKLHIVGDVLLYLRILLHPRVKICEGPFVIRYANTIDWLFLLTSMRKRQNGLHSG